MRLVPFIIIPKGPGLKSIQSVGVRTVQNLTAASMSVSVTINNPLSFRYLFFARDFMVPLATIPPAQIYDLIFNCL